VQCLCVKLVTKACHQAGREGPALATCTVHGQQGLLADDLIKRLGTQACSCWSMDATRGKSVGQRVRGQSNAKGQDSRQRFDLVLQVSALLRCTDHMTRSLELRRTGDAQKILNAERLGIPWRCSVALSARRGQ
jgi:hypothetical protein